MRSKRGHVYKVRLSDEERVALEENARRKGKTAAEYVRTLTETEGPPEALALSTAAGIDRR